MPAAFLKFNARFKMLIVRLRLWDGTGSKLVPFRLAKRGNGWRVGVECVLSRRNLQRSNVRAP